MRLDALAVNAFRNKEEVYGFRGAGHNFRNGYRNDDTNYTYNDYGFSCNVSCGDISSRCRGHFIYNDVGRVTISGNANGYIDSDAILKGSGSNRGNGRSGTRGLYSYRNPPFSFKAANGELVTLRKKL